MPVYKYRSFQAAREHLKELQSSHPLAKLSNLQALLYALRPPKPCAKGVFKFKTLEDANRHRHGVESL